MTPPKEFVINGVCSCDKLCVVKRTEWKPLIAINGTLCFGVINWTVSFKFEILKSTQAVSIKVRFGLKHCY